MFFLLQLVVLTVNLGGVFNFIAYTFVRRKNNEIRSRKENNEQKIVTLNTITSKGFSTGFVNLNGLNIFPARTSKEGENMNTEDIMYEVG